MIVESYRVLETISNVDGTLYKNDLVKLQNKEENVDWRVKDNMGPHGISTLKNYLSHRDVIKRRIKMKISKLVF